MLHLRRQDCGTITALRQPQAQHNWAHGTQLVQHHPCTRKDGSAPRWQRSDYKPHPCWQRPDCKLRTRWQCWAVSYSRTGSSPGQHPPAGAARSSPCHPACGWPPPHRPRYRMPQSQTCTGREGRGCEQALATKIARAWRRCMDMPGGPHGCLRLPATALQDGHQGCAQPTDRPRHHTCATDSPCRLL